MNAADAIQNIRKNNPHLKDGAPIGIVSSFGQVADVTEDRDIVVIATTDDIDLDTEVVVPTGLNGAAYFFRNRKIFVDHRYEMAFAVGKLRSAPPFPGVKNQRGWTIRVHILPTPLGDDILTVAREIGIGASIGFEPLDYGKPSAEEAKRYAQRGKAPRSIVRTANWLETSLTCLPCNVSCQSIDAAAVDDRKAAALDDLVCKSRIARGSAVALGLPTTPNRKYHSATSPGGQPKVLRVNFT